MLRRLYNWVIHWADTRFGAPALAVLSFCESSFFPVPPDPLLMALAVGNPRKALRFAFICSAASVAGGMLGYFIGKELWGAVSPWFFEYVPGFTEHKFHKVADIYAQYDFWFVMVAGFTPIPYKIFTIGAGVFDINFFTFVLASIVGRSARFFLVAGLIKKYGAEIREFIDKYFDLLSIAFIILLIGGFYLVKFVMH